jgi:hypothetical protein
VKVQNYMCGPLVWKCKIICVDLLCEVCGEPKMCDCELVVLKFIKL